MSKKTLRTLRLTTGTLTLCLLAIALTAFAANYPPWWISRGVIKTGPSVTNDYALANLGQLKCFASAARDELNARLPGGAGSNVNSLVTGFSNSNNYVLINVGQLKFVAKPFYDRLIAVGYTNNYPWTTNTVADDNDFAVANLGQLKRVFSFDVSQMVFTQPPVASNDTYSVIEDTSLTVTAPGVLANDFDPEGSNLTAQLVTGVSGLTFNTNGAFTYTPASNWFGVTSFIYRASDGQTTSGTATVTITVNPVNDNPTATITAPTNNSVFLVGSNIVIQVTASDIDGTIANVQFYDGTTNLGQDATSPYSFTWTNGSVARHTLTARSWDDGGGSCTSAPISVIVAVSTNDWDGDGLSNTQEAQLGTDPASSDTDKDGLADLAETQRGTNPLNKDTDGDGIPDGWEVQYNLNPLVNDANLDPDGDGWTNLKEYLRGGRPNVSFSLDTGNALNLQVGTPLDQ